MSLRNTTPVPNVFFDKIMVQLSASAIRVYLKIVRNTHGWRNQTGEFKQRDWISHSQYGDVGVSSRSVTTAVEELLSQSLIIVTDEQGNSLHDPKKRKLAKRIYYAINSHTNENSTFYKAKTDKNNTQNLRSTKENFYKRLNAENTERTSDLVRIRQILQQEAQKQSQRDNWR